VPSLRYARVIPEDLNGPAPGFRYAREIEHGTVPSESLSLSIEQFRILAESMAIVLTRTVAPQQTILQGVNHDN
jgi:hypothetical protein